MRPHEKVLKLLSRFEAVEWLYDGLNGKIIPWTKEHGGTSDDPSVQAFVVAKDGRVLSRCPSPYAASSFSKWLKEQADAYDREFPRTRVPFLIPEFESDGEKGVRCAAFDEAREAGRAILVYFGREPQPDDDRKAKAQVKRSRSFEKGALGSKKAAEAAKGWMLLRFDLAQEAHAEFAKRFGITSAPALLMFPPGAQEPTDLGTKLKGPNLAYHLKKNAQN